MLAHSALYEWQHSVGGHLTYLAGSYSLHVPYWAALYIIINKISAFVAVPTAIFGILALIHLIRIHLTIRNWIVPFRREAEHEGYVEGRKTPPYDGLSFRAKEATTLAFLLIWLLATLVMFSLLNIVVGTHYLLPLAPPIAIAGTYTLVYLARYGIRKMGTAHGGLRKAGDVGVVPCTDPVGMAPRVDARHDPYSADPAPTSETDGSPINVGPELAPNTVNLSTGIDGHHKDADEADGGKPRPYEPPSPRHLDMARGTSTCRGVDDGPAPSRPLRSPSLQLALFLIIGVLLVGPHLLGLLNIAGAEGYTSEFFHGEDTTLQVAYPGYREAAQWLERHTQGDQRIGLVALPQTLQRGDTNASWFVYNSNLPKRLQIQEAHPKDPSYPYDYLVWPMHLIQRGYLLPPSWHIIHKITGGDTTYSYIAVAHKTYANP
jgi:hypothetical protein